jgi:hypothetical protein
MLNDFTEKKLRGQNQSDTAANTTAAKAWNE